MFFSKTRLFLLLFALTFLMVLLGRYIAGPRGAFAVFSLSLIMHFFTYWFSDRLILRLYRAEPVSRDEAPEFYEVAERLAGRASIPTPALYVLPSASPNAFATGRDPNHAAIAVTSGLFELLKEEEFEGVIAHEMGHIIARDTLTATVAAVLAGIVMSLASAMRGMFMLQTRKPVGAGHNPLVFFLMAILAPVAALLIRLAISRDCEFEADKNGAQLCGEPRYLAGALKKMDAEIKKTPLKFGGSTAAHLMILQPFNAAGFDKLFMTHPPIEERLWRLEQMRL